MATQAVPQHFLLRHSVQDACAAALLLQGRPSHLGVFPSVHAEVLTVTGTPSCFTSVLPFLGNCEAKISVCHCVRERCYSSAGQMSSLFIELTRERKLKDAPEGKLHYYA